MWLREDDTLGGGVDVEAALPEHVVDVGDEGAQVGALVQGLAQVGVLAFSSYLSTSAVMAASMSALMAASMLALMAASTLEAVSECSANIIHKL